jgi:hypothetical protein
MEDGEIVSLLPGQSKGGKQWEKRSRIGDLLSSILSSSRDEGLEKESVLPS